MTLTLCSASVAINLEIVIQATEYTEAKRIAWC